MVTASNKSSKGRRNMNFDLNLVPFIDVLSTCICFLLITAVFMQLGTVNVRQALGDGVEKSSQQSATMWLKLGEEGSVQFSVKNVKASRASEFVVRSQGSQPDWNRINQSIKIVKQTYPALQTALILPAAQSRYADLIKLMDSVKKGEVSQVGIAPL